MDKKIKSVKRKVNKGLSALLKEDMKQDKKIAKCDKMKKRK